MMNRKKNGDSGYEIKTKIVGPGRNKIKLAYTLDGLFIGSPRTAEMLCDFLEIKPELSFPDDEICSIGFSEKEGKWFGWNRRAIRGFKIGDTVGPDDSLAKYLPKGFTAETLEMAKIMAISFAKSMS